MLSYQKGSQVWGLMMTSLFRALKVSSVDCLLLSRDGPFGINKHNRAREQQKARSSTREACANPSKYKRSLIWNDQQLKNLCRSYTSFSLLHLCGPLSLIMVSCLAFWDVQTHSCELDVDRGPGKRLKTLIWWEVIARLLNSSTIALRCVNKKAYILYIYLSLQIRFFGRTPHSW